ncbi:hypothetical protein PUMCH_003612 [Australozyma saopauloensis]|uniref:Ribonuclease n=1 Tax=Australozyma saopauloensis TaxID=291208 RepID=A0AAX4HD30_9ASCO|nr:hypothetical protein PUMCH_003612 [[Candida] saopauloensis]
MSTPESAEMELSPSQAEAVIEAADRDVQESAIDEINWLPESVTTINEKFYFDSTTYHTAIPEEIEKHKDGRVILGVDEAGRGPVLGPMVYGIAYCLEDYQEKLKKEYGFADSKVLKEAVRTNLLQLLHDKNHDLYRNVGWATRTMTAKDISNGMLRSLSGPGPYNLNEQAHDTTIQLIKEVLAKGVNLKAIFVDTVGPPASYQAKLKRFFPEIDITVTKKADSLFPIVSAASVAAKVTRDKNLEYFHQNLDLLKGEVLGSGYPSDPNTSRWLNSHVDPVFGWPPGLLRFSWQTAKDSLERAGAAKVTYEDALMKNAGYKDIGDLMGNSKLGLIDALFYGRDCVL